MKSEIKKYLLSTLLCLLPMLVFGQGKVYTKSVKLADFPTKITKVVMTGRPLLDAAIKSEITSGWDASPYEFCSPDEYKEIAESTLYYFLHFTTDGNFTYIDLTKGGPASDSDPLKTSIEVVQMPIGPDGTDFSTAIEYMGVFIDIVQQYATKAAESERAAYSGLKAIYAKPKAGDNVREIEILPTAGKWGTSCYKMKFNPDTHALYKLKKKRISR